MKHILLLLIKLYKLLISPLFPPSCRFYPTCSEYSIEAIQRFGGFYGTILSVKRIVRCNPFNKGGVDPVPEKINKINLKKFFSK